MHNVFSLLYIGGALILLLEHPSRGRALFRLGLSEDKKECLFALESGCHEYPNCLACPRKKAPVPNPEPLRASSDAHPARAAEAATHCAEVPQP